MVVTFGDACGDPRALHHRAKGFLPLQDTASITAVTEAGADVSFAEMQRRQAEAASAIKADPDVVSVVSVIGAGSVNPTTNVGRLVMTLKPRGERADDVAAVIARLKERVAAIPGMTIYFLPVQDVQIGTQSSRSQYQYTLTGADQAQVAEWAKQARRRAAPRSQFPRRLIRGAGGRPARPARYRPSARRPARRQPAGRHRHA